MHTSRYTRLIELPEPTDDGMSHIACNTVAGSVMAVGDHVAEVLERGLSEPISADDFAEVGQETLADLLREGWVLLDDQWEEDRIEAIAERINRALGGVSEYGLVPWPAEGAAVEPEDAMAALTALAEVEDKPNRHYYFHAFTQDHVSTLDRALPGFLEHMAEHPASGEGGRLVVLTAAPSVSIDWEPWNALGDGEARLRLPLYPDPDGDSLQERISRIAEVVGEAAQVGFVSWIVLHMTADAPEGWLDEALAGLVGAGILQICTRPPSVAARNRIDDWREFLCDLNDLDYELIMRLYEEAQSSRRRSMLRVYGGGLVHLLDGMVRDRAGLMHELHFCRSIPTGYYANLAGEIWPCPMMAAGLVEDIDVQPLATFGAAQIDPDPEAVAAWRNRDVLSLEACSGCAGMFNCAGGCALEAVLASGGDLSAIACQPVEELMESVVQTQQRRLTRQFGPVGGGPA